MKRVTYFYLVISNLITLISAQVYLNKFECSFNSTAIIDPASWCYMPQYIDDVFDWDIAYYKPSTRLHSPVRDYTQFLIGSEAVLEQSFILPDSSRSRVTGDNAILLTSLLYAGIYRLRFAYHASGSRSGILRIQCLDEPVGYGEVEYLDTARLLWYYNNRNSENTWKLVELNFTSIENFQISFEFMTDNKQDGTVALDEISITQISTNIGPKLSHAKFNLPSFCSFEPGGTLELEPDCLMNNISNYYIGGNHWFKTPLTEYLLPDHSRGTIDGSVLLLLSHGREVSHVSSSKEFFPDKGCFNVKFYYHTLPYSGMKIHLYLSTSFKPIWSFQLTPIYGWNEVNLKYLRIKNPTRLVFRGFTDNVDNSFIMIDDLSVTSCPSEVNFTECSFSTSLCDFYTTNEDFFYGWYLHTGKSNIWQSGPNDISAVRSYVMFGPPGTALSREGCDETAHLVSPLMSSGEYQLELHYHAFSNKPAHLGILRLLLQSESDNSGELLWFYNGAHNTSMNHEWKQEVLQIFHEEAFRIIFEAVLRTSLYSQFALSQVKIELKPYKEPNYESINLPLDCSFDTSASMTRSCVLSTPSSYEGYEEWVIRTGSSQNGYRKDATTVNGTGSYYSIQSAPQKCCQQRSVTSTEKFYTTSGCVNILFYYYTSRECFKQLNLFLLGSTKPLWSTKESSDFKWVKIVLKDIKMYKPTRLVFEAHSQVMSNCTDSGVGVDGIYIDTCDCTRDLPRDCSDKCAELGRPVKFDQFDCPLCPRCGDPTCANPFQLPSDSKEVDIDEMSQCKWNSLQIGEGKLVCSCKLGYINAAQYNTDHEAECKLNPFTHKPEWTPNIRFKCRDGKIIYYRPEDNACEDPALWIDLSRHTLSTFRYPIRLGIVLTFGCKGDLVPELSETRLGTQIVCTPEGWSMMPSCVHVSCELTEKIDHATVPWPLDVVNHYPGSQVKYTCDTGYEPNGVMDVVCGEDGVWDFDENWPPECQPVICEKLEIPEGTTCQYSRSKEYANGAVVSCSCDEGYKILPGVSDTLVSCLPNRKWNKVNFCHVIECSSPLLASPSFSCSGQLSLSYNSTIQCTCNEGYETPDGTNIITSTCDSNAMWSSVHVCSPIICPEPFFEISALYCKKSDDYHYGAVLPCICDIGYVPFVNNRVVVSAEMRCLKSGTWSKPPECRKVVCRDIRSSGIKNAVLRNKFPPEAVSFTFTYGDALDFMCATDRRVFMVVCTERGVWSNGLNCSNPDDPHTYSIDEIGALISSCAPLYSSTSLLLIAIIVLFKS